MGRKTFDSIGKPLPNRRNIVVTRDPSWRHEGVETANSPQQACTLAQGAAEAFIIGGAELFNQTLTLADRMVVTEIHEEFDCDTFFPEIDSDQWKETERQDYHSATNGLAFAIVIYERVR
jgi:dihydrofolate reductase